MIGNNGNTKYQQLYCNNKNNRLSESCQEETEEKSTKQVSFLQRLNPFYQQSCSNSNNTNKKNPSEEFKSVQSLKQFWNSRISLNNSLDSSVKDKSSKFNISPKSEVCVIKCKSATLDSKSNKSFPYYFSDKNIKNNSKLTSLFTKEDSDDDFSLREISDDFQLKSNPTEDFNKFKNADTVKKKRKSLEFQQNDCSIKRRSIENSEMRKINSTSLYSPIVSNNWMKNDENPLKLTDKENKIDKETKADKMLLKNQNEIIYSTLIAKKETDIIDMEQTKSVVKIADNCSRNSNTASSTNSVNSEIPKKSTTTRKFSFKTNSPHHKNYNRKMAVGGSKVAALTHRFNQMIQQDAGILKEVKKNGRIVVRTPSHVYRIREEGENSINSISKKKSIKKTESIDENSMSQSTNKVRRKTSITKNIREEENDLNGVKASINTFEPNKIRIKIKPKVPDKSEQVLLKTKEIAIKNIKFKTSVVISKENEVPKLNIVQVPNNFSDSRVKLEEISKEKIDLGQIEPIKKESKNKYGRIYEKLRFRFTSKKTIIPITSDKHEEYLPEDNPDQKIVEAICTINQKIDHLSKSVNDLSTTPIITTTNINPEIIPNDSFLYRTTSKNSFGSTYDIQQSITVEAINSHVISKTQSMDETRFPILSNEISDDKNEYYCHIFKQTDDLISKIKKEFGEQNVVEDDYEIINKPIIPVTSEIQTYNDENLYGDKKGDDNNLYQSISEVRELCTKHSDSEDSYESFDNYEKVDDESVTEDGYIICDPPEPPPPRKPSDTTTPTTSHPALPVPKRNLIYEINKIESENPCYEKIKYDKIPPRPPKSMSLYADNVQSTSTDVNHDYDDEIYEAIRNIETNSLISSNCYESINSITRNEFVRLNMLQHSDSMSTLNSDHKTNSLYGTTIGQSTTPPSEGVGSDGSDEWIDISDNEDGEQKQNFIVVRQRAKCHRSPEWSRKVRDQRINQQNSNFNDDDSDHHYESLYSMEEKRLELIKNNENNSQTSVIVNNNDTEYDSFDTDQESEEDVKKDDSGVDISNTRLPDPPPSHKYAIMQKLKNLGSLSEISKSLSRITRKKSTTSPPKTFEYATKQTPELTYDSGQYYENTLLGDKAKKSKFKKLSLASLSPKSTDPYENTEFHSPRTPTIVSQNSTIYSSPTSSQNLNQNGESSLNNGNDSNHSNLSRKKSKISKSFKSKLKKTLVPENGLATNGNSLMSPRSTFYVSDSIDLDSGIFSGSQDKIQASEEIILEQAKPLNVETYSATQIVAPPRRKNKITTPEADRRKTTIGIRPINPPPPPPDKKSLKSKRMTSTTSWYAECGLFKPEIIKDEVMNKEEKIERDSTTSWYADAGLYQTSGDSVASSSGSSGVSTGGEGGPGDDHSHSMFLNEPLYQIYSAAKLESISRDIEEHTDGYEQVGRKTIIFEDEKKNLRPTALQLVSPQQGPSRTLWSDIPEVVNSEFLASLSPNERRLQEAKFEILTSEASYLKSLSLLKSHFMNHPAFRDTSILSSADRKILFSFITPVQECSDRLLCDLESSWQENIMLRGMSHSIFKNAEKYFHVYISYCEHQAKLDRTLKRLKEQKGHFGQTLEVLENDSACYSLSLYSFLMLPMQRITRLPLLIDAVFQKLKIDDEEYNSWKMTGGILSKVVTQCNEAAKKSEQAYEMELISRSMEFPANITPLCILPVGIPAPGTLPRTLIRKGELTQHIFRGEDGKLTFGKKLTRVNIFAFLFTDILVLTKKKSDETYIVTDYCQRSMLTVSSEEFLPHIVTKDAKFPIVMTLLENHDKKMIEMTLDCRSETERTRWLQATEPPSSENPDEKLYEQWDCPQVVADHSYNATQPDELGLDIGDAVNVTKKMGDGWFFGERIRDGVQGWFPGSYTQEISSPHVRARNLKQRYRLLLYSANFLESQKNKI